MEKLWADSSGQISGEKKRQSPSRHWKPISIQIMKHYSEPGVHPEEGCKSRIRVTTRRYQTFEDAIRRLKTSNKADGSM